MMTMTDLEEQFKAAVEAHAVRTGGVMVGDVIAVGDRAVRVTGCEGGRLEFLSGAPLVSESGPTQCRICGTFLSIGLPGMPQMLLPGDIPGPDEVCAGCEAQYGPVSNAKKPPLTG